MLLNKKPLHKEGFLVLEAGLEPARPQWSLDFKSNVSTNSTTRAFTLIVERKTGFEPATPTLAR